MRKLTINKFKSDNALIVFADGHAEKRLLQLTNFKIIVIDTNTWYEFKNINELTNYIIKLIQYFKFKKVILVGVCKISIIQMLIAINLINNFNYILNNCKIGILGCPFAYNFTNGIGDNYKGIELSESIKNFCKNGIPEEIKKFACCKKLYNENRHVFEKIKLFNYCGYNDFWRYELDNLKNINYDYNVVIKCDDNLNYKSVHAILLRHCYKDKQLLTNHINKMFNKL